MTSITTFYFSRVVGCKVYDQQGNYLGHLVDLAVDVQSGAFDSESQFRPRLKALYVKHNGVKLFLNFESIAVKKEKGKYLLFLTGNSAIHSFNEDEMLLLGRAFLDQQIVDTNGKKVVRVNDIRMVCLSDAVYTIAVDVGIEGLLRRLGVAKLMASGLRIVNKRIPSHFIMIDDVAAVDNSNYTIKLSKSSAKLSRIHPSDLADIIEDLSKSSKELVFSNLDNETAADVLEELDTHEQIHIIESLPIDKAADVLEKMPSNEAADIIEELEDEKAEALLNEMDIEASEEVRELLEYSPNSIGSIMTKDYLTFTEANTVEEILTHIRDTKPDMKMLYDIFITDADGYLEGVVSLRDLLVSTPGTTVSQIMTSSPITLLDTGKLNTLAEIMVKYNLLALPVLDKNKVLEGVVVIDDLIEDLAGKRRTI